MTVLQAKESALAAGGHLCKLRREEQRLKDEEQGVVESGYLDGALLRASIRWPS